MNNHFCLIYLTLIVFIFIFIFNFVLLFSSDENACFLSCCHVN